MNNKHTPGKWESKQSRGNNIYEYKVISPNLKTICEMEADSKADIEQVKANAQLIAAAPELLQMVYDLKQCIKRLTQDGLSQFDRDTEAQWIGEAHELLNNVNPDYYSNANKNTVHH